MYPKIRNMHIEFSRIIIQIENSYMLKHFGIISYIINISTSKTNIKIGLWTIYFGVLMMWIILYLSRNILDGWGEDEDEDEFEDEPTIYNF